MALKVISLVSVVRDVIGGEIDDQNENHNRSAECVNCKYTHGSWNRKNGAVIAEVVHYFLHIIQKQ